MENVPMKDVVIKWGAILGGGSILFFYLMALTGNQANNAINWMGMLILVAALVMGIMAYRKENGGLMSFGRGVGVGTMISLVGGAISALFTFIYTKFIDTEYFQPILDKTRADMEMQDLPEAQIDQAMEMTANFMNPVFTAIMGIIISVLAGVIISLIISAILKKEDKVSGPGVY